MPIVAADLIAYNAASRPEDDTSTGGGAIDVNVRPTLTQLAANDDLEVVSSAAGDTTQTVTIDGRDAAGAFVTEVLNLNGVTVVTGTQVFERILSITMSAVAVGTVTVRRQPGGANVYVIPIGELGASGLFISAASQSGAVTRFDKTFWRNAHATLTLNAAQVQLTADPAAVIRQGVAASKGDTATIANRTTIPSGITFVDDSVQQSVPTTILAASENIGVWIEQALAADNAPIRSTFTTELAGTSV